MTLTREKYIQRMIKIRGTVEKIPDFFYYQNTSIYTIGIRAKIIALKTLQYLVGDLWLIYYSFYLFIT